MARKKRRKAPRKKPRNYKREERQRGKSATAYWRGFLTGLAIPL